MSVVKADAYGHGSVQVAKRLEDASLSDYFAVATVNEGLRIRKAGIKKEILVLGYTDKEEMTDAVLSDLNVAVYTREMLLNLNSASLSAGRKAKAHLKIETGMNRIGITADDALVQILSDWKTMDNVLLKGVFSHFSSADMSFEYTEKQFLIFQSAVKTIKEHGFDPIRHISASSAMFQKKYQMDMVRAGIDLYGGVENNGPFRHAQTLKTHPVRLLTIKKGEKVGYGMNFTCERDTVIMTVPCGYGDGYPRKLSNRACLLVNGRRAPIVGNVCMDMLMADVTDAGEIDGKTEVILMGDQMGERITPVELSGLCETIPYEIMLGFSDRAERSWIE